MNYPSYIFQRVITNLKAKIFKITSTFHGPSICNHDLKFVHYMEITTGLLGNLTMNNVICAITFNEDNDFMIHEVAN